LGGRNETQNPKNRQGGARGRHPQKFMNISQDAIETRSFRWKRVKIWMEVKIKKGHLPGLGTPKALRRGSHKKHGGVKGSPWERKGKSESGNRGQTKKRKEGLSGTQIIWEGEKSKEKKKKRGLRGGKTQG